MVQLRTKDKNHSQSIIKGSYSVSVSSSSCPLAGFTSPVSLFSLLFCYNLPDCLGAHHFFQPVSIYLFPKVGGARKGRGMDSARMTLAKSDDLRRTAISIIMEKLISRCTGLRLRLYRGGGGVGTVEGCNRRMGGGTGQGGERGERIGGL